jgi:rRNA-processing protein FCF1
MFEKKDRNMLEFVPEFYLKSLKNLYNEILFTYNKSIEHQVPRYIIEQIECLAENCKVTANEYIKIKRKYTLQYRECCLIAESYDDLKFDFSFILKLLSHFEYT